MKRNTTPTLCVSICLDKEIIESVEFIFKTSVREKAPAILTKKYTIDTANIVYGQTKSDLIFLIDFTADETMLFPTGSIYMDTRIVTKDKKILETNIASFEMKGTLFSEVYDFEECSD